MHRVRMSMKAAREGTHVTPVSIQVGRGRARATRVLTQVTPGRIHGPRGAIQARRKRPPVESGGPPDRAEAYSHDAAATVSDSAGSRLRGRRRSSAEGATCFSPARRAGLPRRRGGCALSGRAQRRFGSTSGARSAADEETSLPL